MTLAQYLMLALAVVSALSWRWNATSAALAFSYFVVQVWWLIDATALGVGELFMVDVLTITLIACKAIARCPDQVYRTAAEHFRCMAGAFTRGDLVVLAIYPLVWACYVVAAGDFARWWLLYGLAVCQFIAAGIEAFLEWRRANAPGDKRDNSSSSGLMFAVARAGQWST